MNGSVRSAFDCTGEMTGNADSARAFVRDAGGDSLQRRTFRIAVTENHRRTELVRALVLWTAPRIYAVALQTLGVLRRTARRWATDGRGQAILGDVHAKHTRSRVIRLNVPFDENLAVAAIEADSYRVCAVRYARECGNGTTGLEGVSELNREARRRDAVGSGACARKYFGEHRHKVHGRQVRDELYFERRSRRGSCDGLYLKRRICGLRTRGDSNTPAKRKNLQWRHTTTMPARANSVHRVSRALRIAPGDVCARRFGSMRGSDHVMKSLSGRGP